MADFLFFFFLASVARTEVLEIASQSVTKSEGTISRETIVTVEGPEAPPKPKSEVKPEGRWSVQVKASPIRSESFGLATKLKDKGNDTQVVEAQVQGRTLYRVRVGHLATKQDAQALLNLLKSKEGLGGAFLVGP
jgi:cell division protein FtsN